MISPTTSKDDDPPQSQFLRSVCLMKGLTLCLFLPFSICFYFSLNETGETRTIPIAICYCDFVFVCFTYSPEEVFSSPLASASSSDNSILEDPFSI